MAYPLYVKGDASMRLLIALLELDEARVLRAEMELCGFQVIIARDGRETLDLLQNEHFDLLALHICLPVLSGAEVMSAYYHSTPVCPPRVLFLMEPELCAVRPAWADCIAPICATPEHLRSLLCVLAKKPLPKLAAAGSGAVSGAVSCFLDTLSLSTNFKGRAYAAWLLERMVSSSVLETQPLGTLYQACASAHQTTPAAVERCLRVAVESVFTQGSMRGIEQYFGATVDPERGKPTNRAFLLQAVHLLRERLCYSLTAERSPNSSEMHHKPAAPTTV